MLIAVSKLSDCDANVRCGVGFRRSAFVAGKAIGASPVSGASRAGRYVCKWVMGWTPPDGIDVP